ncbi:MAG: hypothetical protein Ta2G_17740 [Termitinemataceae bacterium]|nr:MAG: hypothetical protein Ta2G_17740 [Termitinemataceae bacterium]
MCQYTNRENWVIDPILSVDQIEDLRGVLAQNIKQSRQIMHFTQAKLADIAGLSVSYIVDIERCKTWVSEKTMAKIAAAMNMKAYELLIPNETENKNTFDRAVAAGFLENRKSLLKKSVESAMDGLFSDIVSQNQAGDD